MIDRRDRTCVAPAAPTNTGCWDSSTGAATTTACKQSTHTHQGIHREPHLKRDKFNKLIEERCPLKQCLPVPNVFVHLQTFSEAMMSSTHPTVDGYMNWSCLYQPFIYLFVLWMWRKIQLTMRDSKIIQILKGTWGCLAEEKHRWKKNHKKMTGSFVLVRRNL